MFHQIFFECLDLLRLFLVHSWSEEARIRQFAAFLYNSKEYNVAYVTCIAPGAIFNIGLATAASAGCNTLRDLKLFCISNVQMDYILILWT